MSNLFHVIKDPVHGTMQFTSHEDAWVKPFIDSSNFQRLRHIKQLGLGDFIFPGAVHTRFNHCLGCSYVAGQIAQKIGLADEERQLVMIACLLHDIGHGPFSHAFEGIFQDKLIRHEDWTPYFLADFSTDEFFTNYNKRNPKFPLNKEKFRLIADMIMHQPVGQQVLADIVSSQLDADRLDYLLRDGHFCGVRYGEFDFRWMLHCMTIVDTPKGQRLGITHKGIGVVEHYLMARRLMTRNMYHGQKKLAFEALLVELLVNASETLAKNTAFKSVQETRLGKFLMAANQFNADIQKGGDVSTIKQAFLKAHFAEYKELCDYDVFLLIKQLAALSDNSAAVQLAKRLQYRRMPKIIRLHESRVKQIAEQLQAFQRKANDIASWQLMLIETPHQSYSGAEDPIWVVNENGTIKPLDDFSMMINAISDKLERIAFIAFDDAIEHDPRVIEFIKSIE
jgi:HD superfamily phosphohydrolase